MSKKKEKELIIIDEFANLTQEQRDKLFEAVKKYSQQRYMIGYAKGKKDGAACNYFDMIKEKEKNEREGNSDEGIWD